MWCCFHEAGFLSEPGGGLSGSLFTSHNFCTYKNTLSLSGPQLAYQYNGSPVPESGVFPEEAF